MTWGAGERTRDEGAAAAGLARLADRLWRDPLVEFYNRRVLGADRLGDNLVNLRFASPLDVVAEQRHIALRLTEDRAAWLALALGGKGSDPSAAPASLRLRLAEGMLGAVPYLWRHDIAWAATASPLPDHTVSVADVPYPRMWWTYERVLRLDLRLDDGSTRDGPWIDGLLLVHEPGRLEVLRVGSYPDGRNVIVTSEAREGAHYPDECGEHVALAELAFLRSPYVSAVAKSALPANRSARRRLGEAAATLPAVRFVALRDEVEADREADSAGEHAAGRPVDWQVRWLVRGHYRNQWYPSEEAHHLVWVRPFVKGPGDKPFRPPTYDVRR